MMANSRPERASSRAPRRGWSRRTLSTTQHRASGVQQLLALKQQLPAMAANLAPERRRANAGQQQRAHPVGDLRLLQKTHVTMDLNAQAQRADGVLVGASERRHDVVVQQAKVLDLVFGLGNTLAEYLQHVLALGQLTLKGEQVHDVAQGIALEGSGIALEHGLQCLQAAANLVRAAAVDINVQAEEMEKLREELNGILAKASGQPLKKIQQDTDRDFYLNAQEAIDYGLADAVVKEV